MTTPSPASGSLSSQDRSDARTIFGKGEQCQHCGGIHARACPRVSSLKWHTDGSLIEVSYWPDREWSRADIIFPEDVYGDDDE
jgi:hypothetical protein